MQLPVPRLLPAPHLGSLQLSVLQAPLGPVTYQAVQAVPGSEPPILSQDSLEGATIIYEQGELPEKGRR